ncbi:MAG: FHA domain-containing protein, partial [Myxococcales bacterium]|nr:FHA domain-containing protein [Myxococcales bacterium]
MQHLLRAISGPQAGAVYVLGRRTTIGRASDCDIQILHEGVSRHHAKITLQADGGMVLADLSSDNGTFVDDERVTRHLLQPGEAIRIMRSRYAYEHDASAQSVTSAVFRRKVTSGESLRQTADHSKSLAAIRAGMARGLSAAERSRPYSRPQAAAPAPSGARPGAVSSTRAEDDDGLEQVTSVPPVEPFEGRRPTPMGPPPRPTEAALRRRPSVFTPSVEPEGMQHGMQHEDWPAGVGTSPTRETPPPRRAGLATVGLSTDAPEGASSLGVADASSSEGWGSYGWHADDRRRERSTVAGLPSGGVVSSLRAERAPAPSGRMAPSAPAAVVPPRSEVSPGPRAASTGWARPPRSDAPRSMRPSGTLPRLPRIEDESPVAAMPASSPAAPEPEPSDAVPVGRRKITAEYGS